jgi:hypothetical protein
VNGGKTMKIRQRIKTGVSRGLLLVAVLAMSLVPIQALAIVPDLDGDGLIDNCEQVGITLPSPPQGGNTPTYYPPCDPIIENYNRFNCVSPDSKDLFYILKRAEGGSLLPADIEDRISETFFTQLGVVVHFITEQETTIDPVTDTDRWIKLPVYTQGLDVEFQGMKAMRVEESLDYVEPIDDVKNLVVGITEYGTIDWHDDGKIFTKRIVEHIWGVYGSKGQEPLEGLIDNYILEVLLHESGHMMTMTGKHIPKLAGYHLKPGTGFIMDQFVKYTVKGSNIDFSIPEHYGPNVLDMHMNLYDW